MSKEDVYVHLWPDDQIAIAIRSLYALLTPSEAVDVARQLLALAHQTGHDLDRLKKVLEEWPV